MADLHQRVEHDFTLNPPRTDDAARAMDSLSVHAKAFAHHVVDVTPGSREQSTALTKIEEALFHAIAAVARNQPED